MVALRDMLGSSAPESVRKLAKQLDLNKYTIWRWRMLVFSIIGNGADRGGSRLFRQLPNRKSATVERAMKPLLPGDAVLRSDGGNGYKDLAARISWPSIPTARNPFEAQRVFTDREEPVALVAQALVQNQEPGDHRVICWHGVGGQGKSSLHDEIRRRIAGNPDLALAGVDFDVPRHQRLEDAMLKLRGDLAGRGLSLPTFDLAFARHFALERPGENIRQVHPQLYRRGKSLIIDDMLDWSAAGVDLAVEGISAVVPGLNLLYKYGARLTGRLGDWWASRAVKEKLVGLDQLSTSELAERLPQYLGFDIWRARAEIGCPRIVITVDSHEKLAGGELRGDAWLQMMVRENPGALILVFGHD